MTIKNFSRGIPKGRARKLAYLKRNLDEAMAEVKAEQQSTLSDEAMSRALDEIFPPRKTTNEGWQATICILGVLALIGWGIYCIAK